MDWCSLKWSKNLWFFFKRN